MLKLDCQINEKDDHSALIDYNLENTSEKDFFIFTPLYDRSDPLMKPDDTQIYTFWHNETVIHFSKRLWPLFNHKSVLFPELPYLKILKANETFNEQIEISIPIQVSYPYLKQEQQVKESKSEDYQAIKLCKQAVFSIGYMDYPEDEGLIEKAFELIPNELLNIEMPKFDNNEEKLKYLIDKYEELQSSGQYPRKEIKDTYQMSYNNAAKRQKLVQSQPIDINLIVEEKKVF